MYCAPLCTRPYDQDRTLLARESKTNYSVHQPAQEQSQIVIVAPVRIPSRVSVGEVAYMRINMHNSRICTCSNTSTFRSLLRACHVVYLIWSLDVDLPPPRSISREFEVIRCQDLKCGMGLLYLTAQACSFAVFTLYDNTPI